MGGTTVVAGTAIVAKEVGMTVGTMEEVKEMVQVGILEAVKVMVTVRVMAKEKVVPGIQDLHRSECVLRTETLGNVIELDALSCTVRLEQVLVQVQVQ